MSNTIPYLVPTINVTIDKNEEYIGKSYPELISYEEIEDNNIITKFPFEIDIPVSTFKTIWSGLGLDIDKEEVDLENEIFLSGSIDPEELLNALDNMIPELCIKEKKELQYCACCGQMIIEEEINKCYLNKVAKTLYEIARAALSRKEDVIWK